MFWSETALTGINVKKKIDEFDSKSNLTARTCDSSGRKCFK